ncbi:MAG: primosomal protein N' [candidate division Zixibacteria bacterium]|nr:primosomal protein N' [candidate division Zixibacteria bacterium]MBU1469208.1 primosomal protein N' [candidate division Zixibacteria bacterium]MBU2626554.1 primosomal protein N' [candidate division Zixibacteria bacterium]
MIVDVIFVQGPPLPLSYQVPAGLADDISEGCRVVADVRNKKTVGVVWSLQTGNDDSLKKIHEVIDSDPLISLEQRGLIEWMSRYYYSSLGSVLKLFLPKLLMQPDGLLICRTASRLDSEGASPDEILSHLAPNRPIKVSTLKAKLGSQIGFHRRLTDLEKSGLVTVSYRQPRRISTIDELVQLSAADAGEQKLGSKQKLVIEHLQKSGKPMRLSALIKNAKFSRQTIRSLSKKGIVTIKAPPDTSSQFSSVQELMLNREQMDVVESVSKAIIDRTFETFLLYGVTGSGKTEVYVKLIWDALELGKTALLLQPEIALSEQVFSKLSARFGDRICRLHSNVTDSERYAIFKGIESGAIRVVIGPRSAIFSPLRNLGLIIVDEEHDHSYKQGGSAPYYQGRDAAVMLGKLSCCPVLLGSATPSVESWGNAQNGKYTLLRLTTRWDERQMPSIKHIVHRPAAEHEEPLSDYLRERIEECLSSGAQTVLFLNRRGFAPTVKCLDCRATLRCPNCDVGLVFHIASREKVLCHLCGFKSALDHTCQACGAANWGFFGAGTQRIEDYLNLKFPSAVVGRLDADAAEKAGAAKKTLAGFSARKVNILVGTQMVAKGLDFPDVRLVGILGADASMNFPDFRSVERTFALLFQASGRAGRGKYRGEVVVQVDSDESPLLQVTEKSDFAEFLDKELARRTQLGYPPLRHLVLMKLKSGSAERVESAAFELQKKLASARRKYDRFMSVLGPAPAPLFKVLNNYRWRIMIKTSSVASTLTFLDSFIGDPSVRETVRKVRLIIDVDPYDMM